MRLNRWKHWLFVLGFIVIRLTNSSAQHGQKLVAELDVLPGWYPVPRTASSVFQDNSLAYPNAYTSFSHLLKKVKEGSKVEALTIDGIMLKQGGLADLSQLQTVRVLTINLSGAMPLQTDSLFQIIQNWPALERLTITVNPYFPNKTESGGLVTLPAAFMHFPNLHDVRLSGSGFQWDTSFNALAGLKSLRSLDISSWQQVKPLPIYFPQLPQITALRISGINFLVNQQTFSNLSTLSQLTLTNVTIDSVTFQHTLTSLSRLETLALETIRSLRKLAFNELKNLKSVELSGNPDLLVDAATFAGLPGLERLSIRNQQAIDMSGFCSLTQLHTLSISGIRTPTQIPDCISKLDQLTELRIESVPLNRLSDRIGSLKQLQKLSLSHCGLDSLPATLAQLMNLNELGLMGNKLRQMPNIWKLTNLQNLNIANNQLVSLPEELGRLTHLETLAAYNNKLTQLPASIGRLVNLRLLSLQANQLEQLPEELGKLRKLQFLSLNNNQLTGFPASMGQLDSLKRLLIGNNRLRSLPATFSQLKSLIELHIGTNELTALPANFGSLHTLTNLTIETNPITELPASICELYALEYLTIMGTQIRLLPEQIGALTKLRQVTLTNNELIALPTSIGQWQHVTSISLERNRLEGLPNSLGRLGKLGNLRISGKDKVVEGAMGGIQQLPDSIVHCTQLWDLLIDRQPQLDADDVFTKAARMKRLTHLKVTNCNISKLPTIDWKNTAWQMLVLSQNLLTELPVGLLDVPALQTLAVAENRLPESLNRDFHDKESVRVAFIEAGLVPLESLSKPNRRVASAYMQMSAHKARQRDWAGVLSDLGKAIEYAPDTIRSFAYGQRASFHVFRKEYPEALADYDKAIQYAPQLRKEKLSDTMATTRTLATYWQQKAFVLGIMGQYDAALSAITQAESFLPPADTYSPLTGLVHTERGRYLAMKDKLADADSSYRKAIRAYEKLMHPDPGIRLTIVELSLLTGQYDRAKRAIADLPMDQMRDGYATLKEYLEICIAVLKNEQTGAQAMERLTAYLDKHPAKIYGWRFDLFDNWLTKSKLPTEKMATLRQLTDATKERLVKPE
ncbi:leucine-rich repeat protein [Spirosoma sp. KCTC 42546]|uniref:leucine-rich repeat domain-containing protein n=1 Tax=Spirosoma sp. KCTC 42546 TaxID=2520506 RepID=UPI00115AB5DE|nr:leucine-rich repeat protein [Spirosoma sp. KCTC 42546]QDK79030.1 leucine-rich repeat protein [Spirosoma sp. KCTC 42546]